MCTVKYLDAWDGFQRHTFSERDKWNRAAERSVIPKRPNPRWTFVRRLKMRAIRSCNWPKPLRLCASFRWKWKRRIRWEKLSKCLWGLGLMDAKLRRPSFWTSLVEPVATRRLVPWLWSKRRWVLSILRVCRPLENCWSEPPSRIHAKVIWNTSFGDGVPMQNPCGNFCEWLALALECPSQKFVIFSFNCLVRWPWLPRNSANSAMKSRWSDEWFCRATYGLFKF